MRSIKVTQEHINQGIAGSDTHCPISLAVVEDVYSEESSSRFIFFAVSVDCHIPNHFKYQLGMKNDDPMRYSVKIIKSILLDDDTEFVDSTDFIMLDQEVTDWVKLFDSCEWHDNVDQELQPITIEVYDDDGVNHGRLYDERYNTK